MSGSCVNGISSFVPENNEDNETFLSPVLAVHPTTAVIRKHLHFLRLPIPFTSKTDDQELITSLHTTRLSIETCNHPAMATEADYKRLGAWARMLEPDQQIDRHTSHRTVPMQVLSLGCPRTGTLSMQEAYSISTSQARPLRPVLRPPRY